MPSLASKLRKDLENAVKRARLAAETGAGKALDLLAVGHHEPWGSMKDPEKRRLRNRLRAHGVQLGDVRDDKRGTQSITRLTGEVAYEHWHRMLFARYLAENELLIEPESGQAMSMDECRELAREQGKDWIPVACAYAQQMLPEIFRQDDPVLEVALPPETRSELEDVLNELPRDVFLASDSLGWVYQFWQSDQKETVNKSGNKIGADELPAVTQLFTEDYMVDFLLDNTLGAWWAGKVAAASSRSSWADSPGIAAATEADARAAVALPGCPWSYLRFIKVEAASSRLSPVEKRQDAASTLKIGYLDPHAEIENLSGNLPHWRQNQVTYFVTFRTADSLPQEKLRQWTAEKEAWLLQHPEPHDKPTRQSFYEQFPQRIQAWLDHDYGECLLSKPALKARVVEALKHFDGDRYHLDESVVEVNHVHALVTPTSGHELAGILHSWKSFTANVINREAGRTGVFWQKESFDHIVRSPAQLEKIRSYIREHRGYDKVEAASQSGRGILPRGVEAEEKRQDAAATFRNPAPVHDNVEAASSRLALEEKRQDAASTLWRPAAGTFSGWPKTAAAIRALDPCMGSGHFVVAMFERLVALRMAEEKLDEKAAVAAVIRDNLFGLELDPRCTQIGAFNLALAAWRRVGHCALPAMNLACSGLAPNTREADWLAIAGDDEKLQRGMERLYRLFQKAAVLGSLINPRAGEGDLLVAAFHELQPLLEKALKVEEASSLLRHENQSLEGSATIHEMAVTARGLAKAAEILAGQFTLVATNVPYLGRGKQPMRSKPNAAEELADYCERVHPDAKPDLATCFVERCIGLCGANGAVALVTPQNWLLLGIYKKLRRKLLDCSSWNLLAKLGSRAFGGISGEQVNVAMLVMCGSAPEIASTIAGLDVGDDPSPKDKARALVADEVQLIRQTEQVKNPDSRVIVGKLQDLPLLSEYCDSFKGLSSGDLFRFVELFWEHPAIGQGWEAYQRGCESSVVFGGRDSVIFFQDGNGQLRELNALQERDRRRDVQGTQAWTKSGVSINQMHFGATLFSGEKFDENAAAIIPNGRALLPAIWVFVQSAEYQETVRGLDEALKVTNKTLIKVPFDLAHWQKVAAEKYPHGLPQPFSSDPTQWLFNGHPVAAASSRSSGEGKSLEGSATLQVAVARLLGYQWPRQTGSSFPDCPALTADGLEKLADKDGIVCLSATKGETPAADRLNALLAAAFGSEWSSAKARELVSATGSKAKSLADWLSDDFFAQHCDLFHQRPYIWHVWDGLKGGFSALVNYHRLAESGRGILPLDRKQTEAGSLSHSGRRTLDKLIYTYLGEWIDAQRKAQKAGVEGADARLTAAEHLSVQLKAILAGEPPFDLFIRWKPLHEQPIGWNPDINDGVRLNLRPFIAAKPLGARGKTACILRATPKVSWDKDRGKDPQRAKADSPWFWTWDEATADFKGGSAFDGNRWNDCHYSNATKQAARERQNK